jgi:hypothetical protein
MPEAEAKEYMKAWTELKTPKSPGTGKKYIVKKK